MHLSGTMKKGIEVNYCYFGLPRYLDKLEFNSLRKIKEVKTLYGHSWLVDNMDETKHSFIQFDKPIDLSLGSQYVRDNYGAFSMIESMKRVIRRSLDGPGDWFCLVRYDIRLFEEFVPSYYIRSLSIDDPILLVNSYDSSRMNTKFSDYYRGAQDAFLLLNRKACIKLLELDYNISKDMSYHKRVEDNFIRLMGQNGVRVVYSSYQAPFAWDLVRGNGDVYHTKIWIEILREFWGILQRFIRVTKALCFRL